ncbi:MAG: DUF6036 family nucleotidyltransferase [Candidatus Saliniplasma sp.]
MIRKFIERENQIFEELTNFNENKLEYILVGGYAISAFNHRFSVDADIVIKSSNLEKYSKLLKNDGFEQVQRKKLESVYDGEFISFKKERGLPVTIDILVDSLECRQTGASWSYSYLNEHAMIMDIEGAERSVESYIPEKELLVAIKLHSGRLTDVRDVIALSEDIDIGKVKKHMNRGDKNDLSITLKQIKKILEKEGFEDSFKGVFSEKELPEDNIQKILELISSFI